MKSETTKQTHLSSRMARRIGALAAMASLGLALPAAIFAEPVAMGLAAGVATISAILGVRANRKMEQEDRRSGEADRRHKVATAG